MAELRRDPLTGRWVILAASRLRAAARRARPPPRPRRARSGGRRRRRLPVLPGPRAPRPRPRSRASALVRPIDRLAGPRRAEPLPVRRWRRGEAPAGDDLRRHRPAGGVHEVAVLSPAHHRSLGQPRRRRRSCSGPARPAGPGPAHAAAGHPATQVMVNHGADGGASLTHPHAQIVAIDLVAPGARAGGRPRCGRRLVRAVPRARAARPRRRPARVAGDDAPVWCPWWSSTAVRAAAGTAAAPGPLRGRRATSSTRSRPRCARAWPGSTSASATRPTT